MVFNWYEYLNIAKFLYINGNKLDQITQESAYRCAISKAYNASYCHARDYAQNKFGFIPKELGEDHGAVKNEFKRKGKAYGDIPEILFRLRQWRNQCDYDDIVVDNISEIVQKAIDNAQKIFDRLNYPQPKK